MQVTDGAGNIWAIDEGLRERAQLIRDQFQDIVGHVEVDQIIFIRLSNGRKLKWHGKCFSIGKPPFPIISKFVCYKLQKFGMLNLENTSSVDGDIFDLKYVIAINEDRIAMQLGDTQRIEDIVLLHEMMHIPSPGTCTKREGEYLVKHDIEDFKFLVDKFGSSWGMGVFKDSEEEEQLKRFVPISGPMTDWSAEESD